MVAARLALPWAVEQAVRLGICVLVQRVIPRRLTIAAETARAESRRKRERILSNGGRNKVSMKVLSGDIVRLPADPVVKKSVRQCNDNEPAIATYLGDWSGRGGELEGWLSSGEEAEGTADQTSSDPSGRPGEDIRESTGLSEPQDWGDAPIRPASKI